LNYKNPPTPCLWQAPASAQKTRRKTRPAAIRRSARWRATWRANGGFGAVPPRASPANGRPAVKACWVPTAGSHIPGRATPERDPKMAGRYSDAGGRLPIRKTVRAGFRLNPIIHSAQAIRILAVIITAHFKQPHVAAFGSLEARRSTACLGSSSSSSSANNQITCH